MVSVTGLFDHYSDAQAAVEELHRAGIAHDDISVVASNADGSYDARSSDTADAAGTGAGIGALVGGTGGLLTGLGVMAIPVLLLVLHGPIATNVLNVYSFGVTAQALDIKLGRRTLNVLVGILALAASVFFVFQEDAAKTLDAWLVGVVGWVATWGAIMLVHYYVFERRSTRYGHLFDDVGSTRLPDVNWRALTAFAVGIFGTWMFLNGMVPALQGYGSRALGGLDISWLAGGGSAALTYYVLARTSHRQWVTRQQEFRPTSESARPPLPVD